ncbi:XDD4 family exosortase-dependent surface protein [Nostoc sp. 'Peltigera malacea cyanobiont' DB3992]|uniref:XDD4 family exosortase-dependent surface protein n=1 Tax=Nostoc sp. 'Peltigera malacea cyanobiont' DB3992 TaxID=1206980 RepID=UPI002FDCF3BC
MSFSATGTNTYDKSNDPLAASVLFNYLDNGLLSLTLTNNSSVGISNPSDVLTSVFWDYAGSALKNLSLVSALAPTVTSSAGSTTTKNVDLLALKEWKLPKHE